MGVAMAAVAVVAGYTQFAQQSSTQKAQVSVGDIEGTV